MSWNVEVKKHYENVSKTYDVLDIISNDEIKLKNGLRDVIVDEMKLSCKCILNEFKDADNINHQNASLFLDALKYGYDICVIVEARNFIYNLI